MAWKSKGKYTLLQFWYYSNNFGMNSVVLILAKRSIIYVIHFKNAGLGKVVVEKYESQQKLSYCDQSTNNLRMMYHCSNFNSMRPRDPYVTSVKHLLGCGSYIWNNLAYHVRLICTLKICTSLWNPVMVAHENYCIQCLALNSIS